MSSPASSQQPPNHPSPPHSAHPGSFNLSFHSSQSSQNIHPSDPPSQNHSFTTQPLATSGLEGQRLVSRDGSQFNSVSTSLFLQKNFEVQSSERMTSPLQTPLFFDSLDAKNSFESPFAPSKTLQNSFSSPQNHFSSPRTSTTFSSSFPPPDQTRELDFQSKTNIFQFEKQVSFFCFFLFFFVFLIKVSLCETFFHFFSFKLLFFYSFFNVLSFYFYLNLSLGF